MSKGQLRELYSKRQCIKDEIEKLNSHLSLVDIQIRQAKIDIIPYSDERERILNFYKLVRRFCNKYETKSRERAPLYFYVEFDIEQKQFGDEYKNLDIRGTRQQLRVPIPDEELRGLLFDFGVEYKYSYLEPIFDESGFRDYEQRVIFSIEDQIDETYDYSEEDFKVISL